MKRGGGGILGGVAENLPASYKGIYFLELHIEMPTFSFIRT